MRNVVPYETLLSDIEYMDPHRSAVSKLLESIGAIEMKGGLSGAEDIPDDLNSVEDVISLLHRIKITTDQMPKVEKDLDSVNRCLHALNFSSSKPRVSSPDNIKVALDRFISNSSDMVMEHFVFTRWNADYDDHIFRSLMIFGHEAPSPWNNQGTEFSFKAKDVPSAESVGSSKRKMETSFFHDLPDSLLFATKPIEQAVVDWKKVLEKSAVKMNLKERARDFRCITVRDEKLRKEIWKKMGVTSAFLEGKYGKGDKGKKRVKLDTVTAGPTLSSFEELSEFL
jgi:hypothetical protein